MTQLEQIRQGIEALSHHFFVPDIITPQTQLVFILESPHVQELKYGVPVSGSSGASMTKHLFGAEYAKLPLGRLIKQNHDHQVHRPRLDAIGLMNVCNIPMQGVAYGTSSLRTEFGQTIALLEHIRSNNQRNHFREDAFNDCQEYLLQQFRNRLRTLQKQSLILVPCGRFAQKFFRLAEVSSPSWRVITGVPHPSYNSWDRPRYGAFIDQVHAAFAQLSG